MTETDMAAPETKAKTPKTPMFIGLLLAVVGGGGGFYAVQSGLLPFGDSPTESQQDPLSEAVSAQNGGIPGTGSKAAPVGDIVFVPIEPMLVSLGPNADARHLRFKAQIETSSVHAPEVELLMPRIVDVLNSYLRAVAETDLEKPTALVRLRAQMLRRVQLVTGPGRVKNLLIMEFVLN